MHNSLYPECRAGTNRLSGGQRSCRFRCLSRIILSANDWKATICGERSESLVISPRHTYVSFWISGMSQSSTMPFSSFTYVRYSYCIIRNSSSISPGILTFISERSSLRCSPLPYSICALAQSPRSSSNRFIKYILLSL